VALPELLVDISRLEELKAVSETPAGLSIGALTTHAAIEDGRLPDPFNGLLRRVASQISYRAVRNHGTIGGSVSLADPAADWAPCLMALGAHVRIGGSAATRHQPVREFVTGPYETTLTPGEIVLGFDLPTPQAPLRWGFAKVARKSGAFANSIAVVVSQGKDGPVSIALGAAGPAPRLLGRTGRALSNAAGEEPLRTAIAEDLRTAAPDADAYQQRLHTATVLRAVREMRAS
jgi:carbon-monoxide dehydrogenase medium subunit